MDEDFEVWPEHWDSVMMFLRMSTQWNVSHAGVTGLHYPSLLAMMEVYNVKDNRTMFENIQVMEIAALQTFNKRSS